MLCAKRGGTVVMGGDGQVSFGDQIVKATAVKIRRLEKWRALAGFAGAAADSFTLLDFFEKKMESHQGQLLRAAVELSKEWRTDRMLRRLEAMLAIADAKHLLVLSGAGDVLEPEHQVAAIGSGAGYAEAAARALMENTDLPARAVVEKSLAIAADICVYTNNRITVHEIHE